MTTPEFDALVPANYDVRCETTVGITSTVEICSKPLDYKISYFMDLVLIGLILFIFIPLFIKQR